MDKKQKLIIILSAIIFSACFGLREETFAASYYATGTLISTNLLSEQNVASIDSFFASSTIAAGTSLCVQFATTSTSGPWYNAPGTLDATTTVENGTSAIDLSGLVWSGPNFYYKMHFNSNATQDATPILEEIRVSYTPNNSPDTPTSLTQYKSDCSTVISTAGWTNETEICIKASISDPDTQDLVKLQIEIVTSSDSFSNSPAHTATSYCTSTCISTVSITGLIDGTQYKWQARSIDDDLATSSWSQFNSGNIAFGIDTSVPTSVSIATPYPGGSRVSPPEEEKSVEKASEIVEKISKEIKEISAEAKEILKKIAKVFRPEPPEEIKPPEVPIEELVPKEAPWAMSGKLKLLITYTIENKPLTKFNLAPLPGEFRRLAEKFPELGETLKKVGITKITDIGKLKTVKLTLPGLTERVGLPTAKVEPGKFALPQGMPVAELSAQAKQQIPSEIVFAKTGGELIDFNIALTVTEKGEPQQKITTISGKPLQLVVKPDKPVKSVKGYVVFKSKTPRPTSFQFPFDLLTASLIFANPVFAQPQENPVRVEEKLVLLEFEYTDPDGDGIYTAEIQAPIVEGEYEIITVMDFEDPDLGKKEIRLITVVDPEGYIYRKEEKEETRIVGAIVSFYWLNPETKQYELWPAKEYQQENPQITDVRGTYSFLVPEGIYYLKVEAPGYMTYEGESFQVKEGSGIHQNIELKKHWWWLKAFRWERIILVLVVIFLIFNFYRDKIREKLLRKSKNL